MQYTTEDFLIQARAAYHDLMTGKAVRVVVDGLSGGRVEYNTANADRLKAYIADLEGLINSTQRWVPPAGVWF